MGSSASETSSIWNATCAIWSKSIAKVFHFITELSTGGAQFALYRLLSGLDRDVFTLRVACLYHGDGSVAQRIRALDIPVTDLRMTTKWRWDAFARLYRLLRREKPDILHTWLFHANIPGRVLGRLAGVPRIISSERTMEMESRPRRWLNRLTSPLPDRVTCVSQSVARFAAHTIGLPSEKLVVIPNGIPISQFTNLPTSARARAALCLPLHTPLIGTVSRAHPVKGLDVLLEAFARLLHSPTDAQQISNLTNIRPFVSSPLADLLIVGDGPQLGALQAQAVGLGLGERVHFLGSRNDVPQVLAALDVFVLPSLHEGMPNAILEAMAAGLPVVATAVGGAPEVVVDGVSGLIVPPRDPLALADALSRLLDDAALRDRMGAAGRQRVEENFSQARMVRETERLYQELMS
jgi:sugar transferase (PEP-CTERM/EpsH1 system associated)